MFRGDGGSSALAKLAFSGSSSDRNGVKTANTASVNKTTKPINAARLELNLTHATQSRDRLADLIVTV
jgi:hypothetical protein